MKAKHLLLSVSCLAALGVNAQNFSYTAGETIPDGTGSQKEKLVVWFDTDFHYFDKLDGGDTQSSIYSAAGADLVSSADKAAENADDLHGAILEPVCENGMWFATVPAKTQYPSEADVTSGTVLFRLILGSKPNRINDVDNSWNAYLGKEGYECTGVYVGVQAPASAKVNVYLSTPAVDRKDGYGKIPRAAYFDFEGTLNNNGYTELTSGAAYNDDAVIAYKPNNWDDGYCCKYVEVAFHNVKPGDKVGFRGIQTLYAGYTPTSMGGSSAIEAVEAVDGDAPVTFYNLQGVKVDGANLAPGLYIRQQGAEATKVVIK